MSILVTGGTGFIGSHTVVQLLEKGYDVVIVDNLVNSKIEVLNRIEKITGKKPRFYKVNCCDEKEFRKVFEQEKIDEVIHFAGLKSVAESVAKPELYISNNIGSSKVLLGLMKEFNVHNLVFSSSATVYGVPTHVPLSENDPVGGCTNPYGQTKLDIEYLLKDFVKENPEMNVAILRYFNPIGAHPSGLIGEDPQGIPNNLMPYVTQVAIGKRDHLNVYGNDYKTVDGTGVRDYIHVVDLARGHLFALKKLEENPGLVIYNLGTGKGTSVLELVHAFENANNIKINYEICPRRDGDVDENYAECSKAFNEMGFKTELTVYDACKDSWNWQTKNPNGYEEKKGCMKKITLEVNETDVLHGNSWEVENPIANVVVMQGMEEYGARYDGLATFLNSNRINVYALDCYGQGDNVSDDLHNASIWPKDGFAKQVCAHHAMVEKAKENGCVTYIFAHSMGSYMCQDYIQRFPGSVEKVIMCGSGCYNPAVGLGYVLARIMTIRKNRDKKAKLLNKLMFGNFNQKIAKKETDFDWLSYNNDNVKKYIDDPKCGFGPTNGFCYEFLHGMKYLYKKEGLAKINKEQKIFLITGDEDPVTNYSKATDTLIKMYKDLGVKNVSSKVYPHARHEILFEDCKEEVYKDVLDFFLR